MPNGLRFRIQFENINGELQEELIAIIQSIIQGKRAEAGDRKKIDMVCSLINIFDATPKQQIMFSFNDEMIIAGGEQADNYAIKIHSRKNLERYFETINYETSGFEQDESGCKVYGYDFLTMLSILRKTIIDYNQIKNIQGSDLHTVKLNPKRINRFIVNYNEKLEAAKAKLEAETNSNLFETKDNVIDDLMSMFNIDERG